MSELKHWQEEGAPPAFERLLRAAREEQPSSAGVQRALVATGIVGAGALTSSAAAGATGSAASKAMTLAMAKWFAIGVMSAGAVVATGEVVQHQRAAGRAASPSASAPVARAASRDGTARPARPVGPTSETVIREPGSDSTNETGRATPALEAAATEQPSPASAPAKPDRTLLEEMALIDAARSRLRTADAAGALRSASDYGRRFPAGRFAPEALFLVMQAQNQLGHRQAALQAAREIVRRYPNGAQVGRARELLQSEQAVENP